MSGFVGSRARKRRRNIFLSLGIVILIVIIILSFPNFETQNNEIIPNEYLLPVDELRAWIDAIESVHSEWKMNKGKERRVNLKLIQHVRNLLSPTAHGIALSKAYDLLFEE